eukprot:4639130-Heterocapsa_arctica.AAC.1
MPHSGNHNFRPARRSPQGNKGGQYGVPTQGQQLRQLCPMGKIIEFIRDGRGRHHRQGFLEHHRGHQALQVPSSQLHGQDLDT